MSQIDEVRQSFIALWGQMAAFWGISPATARVYGWLLSNAEPQDTDQIMDGLRMSRGAVSMACRELRDWGIIFPEKVGGARRISYQPETNLEKVIRNIVINRKRREWDPILDQVREAIPRLRSDRSREAAVFRERLVQIEAVVGMADTMAEKFLKGGVVQRLGLKLLVGREKKKRGRPRS